MNPKWLLWFVVAAGTVPVVAAAPPRDASPPVDASSLTGKVMCGYQGWFAAPGDGSGRGWVHYGAGKDFEPGKCTIDLWPDVSELDDDEKFPTAFRHNDGSVAHVYSPYRRKTVVRHFAWMREHGIDGVFLQRFGSSVRRPGIVRQHRDQVTANVREGARQHGRVWALMYDLSGLDAGEIGTVVIEDWKRLVDDTRLRRDPRYLHHRGRPVVAVWGVGFGGDDRKYSLAECEQLVRFLKDDPKYGGNTVMLGVPSFWRSQTRDATRDPALHRVLAQADIISPWTVGRYRAPEQVRKHAREVIAPDIDWTRRRGIDHLPVIFPGFSWHNLQQAHGREAALGQIPRLDGRFLWSQAAEFKRAGAQMLYVAMFDEVDEGTAVFKCSDDPPVGASPFLGNDGLPTDHYLWLTGEIGKRMRGEEARWEMPRR